MGGPRARDRAARRAGALAVLLVVTGCGHGGKEVTVQPEPMPTLAPPASTAPSPSASPTVVPTSPPTSRPPSPSGSASPSPATPSPTASARTTLRQGDEGPQVLALQERLRELGYWLGTPDGRFGDLTEQAVWALQKAAGLQRDAVVGPRTRAALAEGVVPGPRSRSGRVVEIDLARQLVLLVDDGRLALALNTSTGSGATYWYQGRARIASTPRGWFEVYHQIDGLRVSPLGVLWRPKYFVGGIALHGSPSVPPWPASHGCVRLSNGAIDHLWAAGLVPLGTTVWVY